MMHASISKKRSIFLSSTGLILLSWLCVIPVQYAFAEENPAASAPAAQTGTTHILPSKITPVHDSSDDEGLSKAAPDIQTAMTSENLAELDQITLAPDSEDFDAGEDWKDLSRKHLLQKFSDLSPKGETPKDRQLNLNRLVTIAPDADDTAKTSKEFPLDLYSLRLKKLQEFGAMPQILELYKKNQGTPPTSEAAEAGITAMLWARESGLACLEQKALPEELRSNNKPLWDKVDLFCKGLLSPASGEDEAQKFINASRIYVTATSLETPESIDDLNKADQISIMALASIGKLPASIKDREELKKIDDLPLALLLQLGPQEGEVRDNLLAQAREREMIQSTNTAVEQPDTAPPSDKEDDKDVKEEDKKEPTSDEETQESLEPKK